MGARKTRLDVQLTIRCHSHNASYVAQLGDNVEAGVAYWVICQCVYFSCAEALGSIPMRALFFLFVSRICNLSADGHSLTTLWAMATPLTPFLFHPHHLHLAQRTAATGHNDNREDSNQVTNHALSRSHPLQCTTTVIATTATMTRRCGQRPPWQ